jgi:hypothetical protein
LTVSLPICIPFIPSSCVIALARNSSTMLNRSGDSGHRCLVPDFRGNGFSFSPLSIMLAVGLSYIAFIMLRNFPSIPSFNKIYISEKNLCCTTNKFSILYLASNGKNMKC